MTIERQEPTDPRDVGGDMTYIGPGRHETVFDTRRAVLLDRTDVALVEPYRQGQKGSPVLAMFLQGRINKTEERARILYLFDEDGAAALVSELIALASRVGPAFRDRLMDRVQPHRRGPHMSNGCRSCGAEVVFVPSDKSGKPMILDAEPKKGVVLVDWDVGPWGVRHDTDETEPKKLTARVVDVYTDHHVSCPRAADWRGRTRRKTPA